MRKTALLSTSMILIATILYFAFGWRGIAPAICLFVLLFLFENPIKKSNEKYRTERRLLNDEAKRQNEGNNQCRKCGGVSTEITAQGYKLIKNPTATLNSHIEDNYDLVYYMEYYCLDCEEITAV
jgi:hypothetical protein